MASCRQDNSQTFVSARYSAGQRRQGFSREGRWQTDEWKDLRLIEQAEKTKMWAEYLKLQREEAWRHALRHDELLDDVDLLVQPVAVGFHEQTCDARNVAAFAYS